MRRQWLRYRFIGYTVAPVQRRLLSTWVKL